MPIEKIEKNVAVMIPFGGTDPQRQRRSILNFLRIKHLIENVIEVQLLPRESDSKINYKVKHARTEVGSIPEEALRTILSADILIGLITEINVNVIYELAVRNLLKGTLILLVSGDPEELLPLYMRTMAHIRYDNATSNNMKISLDHMVDSNYLPLRFDGLAPTELIKVIEKEDDLLRDSLQDALLRIEQNPNAPPGGVNFIKDLNPGRNLSSWYSFYPYNVVRVRWRKMDSNDCYDPKDMEGGPIVYNANDDFFDIFNFNISADQFEPEREKITPARLVEKIKRDGCVDPEHLQAWEQDQHRLTEEILFNNSFARAQVPLRFNNEHSRKAYRNSVYLPCLVARRIVGDSNRPHSLYLLVIFIELSEVSEWTKPLAPATA